MKICFIINVIIICGFVWQICECCEVYDNAIGKKQKIKSILWFVLSSAVFCIVLAALYNIFGLTTSDDINKYLNNIINF
jgi:energy-coupling factor transporter transmembrane protein EcfT